MVKEVQKPYKEAASEKRGPLRPVRASPMYTEGERGDHGGETFKDPQVFSTGSALVKKN